jgi:hypothetical protein
MRSIAPIWRALALATLSLGACVHRNYQPVRSPPHAPVARAPGRVELYTTKPPDRPYVEVAILSSEFGLDDVKDYAAELGCDAIFLLAPEAVPKSASWERATCLMYVDPTTPSPGAR